MMLSSYLTEVLGNSQSLDGGAMFGNAPRALWETWIKPDSIGRISLACRSMLIEIDSTKILCEVGVGCFFDPTLAERYGVTEADHVLIKNLNRIGLSDQDIDFVILSHLHFDHAGGLLPPWSDTRGAPTRLLFPKAKYVVGKEALQRAVAPHPRDRASFIPELPHLLQSSSRLIVVEGESHPEVLPERIRFFYTHGHTPGHMHTVVQGNSQTVTFAGDLVPGTAWVNLPITMGYDRYAEKVIDEKQDLYNSISGEMNQWLFYTHDNITALSRIVRTPKGKYTPEELIVKPERWSF
jgi:glyoxylase-like metal-dependent hydrolase (beta-lactamase superfamily II)